MPYAKHYISASEIGDYTFCKRGWWLKFHDLLPESEASSGRMAEGSRVHESVTRTVSFHADALRIAMLCILGGILLLAGYFVMAP
jgi:CRISPR/Cas system-associated exonuclease Cas4 (RecB family)